MLVPLVVQTACGKKCGKKMLSTSTEKSVTRNSRFAGALDVENSLCL